MMRHLLDGILRPSTLRFFREWRAVPNRSLFDFLHGYAYGRWVYLYISLGTGEHPLAKKLAPLFSFLWHNGGPPDSEEVSVPFNEIDREHTAFADGYHGKVVPLISARQLVSVQRDISGTLPERVIPVSRSTFASLLVSLSPVSSLSIILDGPAPSRKTKRLPSYKQKMSAATSTTHFSRMQC